MLTSFLPPTARILLIVMCCGLLGGCSTDSLPNMRLLVRYILNHDDRHGNLTSDYGGLYRPAPDQVRGVVSGVDSRFRRYLKVEAAVSGEPLLGGNRVMLLQNGPAAYQAMFAAIGSAQNSVNLESLIFSDDPVGQEFAAALIAARRRGARVNVIYDAFGSLSTPDQFFDNLRKHGVSVLEFNPIDPFATRHWWWPWNSWSIWPRDHRKLLIVDGKTAFTGGINITADYEKGISARPRGENAPDMWRDTDVEIQGPAVTKLQELFVGHWVQQTGKLLPPADYFPVQDSPGNVTVRVIGSSQDAGFSRMYVSLIAAIWHSERDVYITTPYFAPDEQLLRALKQAAARGVDVKLLLPKHIDYQITRYAAQHYYGQLLDAGVKIYERRDAILHAKTVMIDAVSSTVGSTNLDWLSLARNEEINITILDPHFAAEMERAFAADLEQSVEITQKQWENRPCRARIRDWLASTMDGFL